MVYDNDGPIYSMLSGKLFNSAPCAYGESNTGACTGWCDEIPVGFYDPGNTARALAWCDEYATYYGGPCLGVVEYLDPIETFSHIAYACFPAGSHPRRFPNGQPNFQAE